MSDENLEIVLAGIESWNQGDIREVLDIIHRDLEWHPGPLLLDVDEVYRGHEGVLRFWDEFVSPFESLTLEPLRRAASRDEVVVEARFRARGRDGIEGDAFTYQRFTMRDGKLARFEAYDSWEEALAAAGLA